MYGLDLMGPQHSKLFPALGLKSKLHKIISSSKLALNLVPAKQKKCSTCGGGEEDVGGGDHGYSRSLN